jgi:enterochelin esterase-like enzyme
MALGIILGLIFTLVIFLSLRSNLRTSVEVKSKTTFFRFVPFSYNSRAKHQGKLEEITYETHDYLSGGNPKRVITKHAMVYVPYGYDPTKKYNIIYLMHGMGGNYQTWLGSSTSPRMGKNYLDHMIQNHKMPQTLVVTPTYYQGDSAYKTNDEDSELTKVFGEELKNDLMPVVETLYSTYASKANPKGFEESRGHRAFAGFSMGGVTTWYRMCDSMKYFKYFMPYSGSLHWGVESLASDDGDWDASYLASHIKEQGYGASDFFVYAGCGALDYGREVMDPAIESMMKYPAYFKFGRKTDPETNCMFGISVYEYHTASCRNRSLYNTFPYVLKKMESMDQ